MRTGNRFGELVEERLLDLGEFGRIHDLKDVFDLVQEHDLFRAVDLWPVSQQAQNHLHLSAGS